jgi:superfamily II DNA or RNA helicase
MADVREVVQREAKDAFLSSRRRNTIIASVGSGKSKIALDIIKELEPQTILLLTNAVNLRDVNWKNEFEKFGMLEYWDRIVSRTYQGSYDNAELLAWDFDLAIFDEIDFACTPQYSKCFDIPAKAVLGLTGFITEDKRGFLQLYFPVCYEITTQTMQDDNMLNKSEFIFVEYPLCKERNIDQKLKTGGIFKTSENSQYEFWDKKHQQALVTKSALEKKYRSSLIDFTQQKDWVAADWNFKFTATKRKAILHNLASSAKVTMELLRHIHSSEGNKVLIFSANTKQCDKFPNPFHSKRVVANIEDLNAGRVKDLSVVKKITRGVNLVGVNYLIRESYDGSEETFQQSYGRLLRLRPDQIAKYIVLIPYYSALTRHSDGGFRQTILTTQASKWASKMSQSSELENVRYIKLGEDYKLPDGIVL